MTIGERIKQRREELNLTQEELANRLGYKSRTAISNVEKNKEDLTSTRIRKFAEALEVTPGYLMGWTKLDLSNFQLSNANMEDMFKSCESLSPTEVPDIIISDKGNHILAEIKSTGDRKEALIKQAIRLYEYYQKASPEIQQAVDLLLKADKQD